MSTPPPYVLLWCAYGGERWLREARFSILSAQRYLQGGAASGGRVVVITDKPEQFTPLVGPAGAVHAVDAKVLAGWRGPHDFVYRIKVEALAFALAEHKLPTLLLDSDTYFTRPPDPLMRRLVPGTAMMDRPDGLIFAGPQYEKFAGLLRDAYPQNRIELPGRPPLEIDLNRLTMWIAGTVGIHPADAGLVDDVRAAVDTIYPRLGSFMAEQYAFAHVLQDRAKLIRSDGTVEHYWGDWTDPYFGVTKRRWATQQYEPLLEEVAGKPLPEAAAAARRLTVRPYRRPSYYRVAAKVAKLVGRPIDRPAEQEAK